MTNPRKTKVREYERETSGKRTRVSKHERGLPQQSRTSVKPDGSSSFSRRKVRLEKSYPNIEGIESDYLAAGYERPVPGTTNPKFADLEMVLSLDGPKREHHRIWDLGSYWKIESHLDQEDPMEDPIGHLDKDVIAPELDPELREENFNDTQVIYITKSDSR